MRSEIQSEWALRSASERVRWRFLALTMALVACLLAFGCLGAGADGADDPAMQNSRLRAARIEALQESIEADHRTLENLITQPGQAADASLHANPELRAIATRLTDQERELEELTSMVAAEAAPSE